jgi:hypothetical protein
LTKLDIKYPALKVSLVGTDENSLVLMGRVRDALRYAEVPAEDCLKFMEEAASGDYKNLISVCKKWVSIK